VEEVDLRLTTRVNFAEARAAECGPGFRQRDSRSTLKNGSTLVTISLLPREQSKITATTLALVAFALYEKRSMRSCEPE